MILILPIPMVWGLQINLRRRLALLGIFLLGTLYAPFPILSTPQPSPIPLLPPPN